MESLELQIIQSLIHDPDFFKQVIPYIDQKCFTDKVYSKLAYAIRKIYEKQREIATIEVLRSTMKDAKLTAEESAKLEQTFNQLENDYHPQPIKAFLEEVQKHIRRIKVEDNLRQMIAEFGDSHKVPDGNRIKELSEASNFTFDSTDYYNYYDDFEERIQNYTKKEDRFEFPLTALNNATSGGMTRKSLSVVMASTGGGKSIFLCNAAAHLLTTGYNVLYVTCEMSVEEIAKRVDANLLDATQDSMMSGDTDAQHLKAKMKSLDRSKWGQFFLKEYPAGYANAVMIQRDLDEIKRTKGFDIDVLIVDYLNLMATSRYSTKNANTYTIVKAIAEELRGIGQEYNIPILTATQSNRSAFSKELRIDGGLETVSDSIGLPQTADFMFNIIDTQDSDWQRQHWRLIKILKNRWGDGGKQFIKVRLKTDYARFEDVADCLTPMTSKPNELEVTNLGNNKAEAVLKSKDPQKTAGTNPPKSNSNDMTEIENIFG